MMGILEIYNNYLDLGINCRPITQGDEFNMVRDFIDYKKNSFKPTPTRNLAVFLETKINGSYPDVILTEYDPRKYENWNIARNTLSSTDLKILHFIYSKRNVTSQKLINDLSIQYRTLLCSIESLLDAKLIVRNSGYWGIPDREKLFGVKRIEAVEAKISKWDVVMQQAIINKAFASESFVLSKRKREPESDVVKRISNFGIGIYLYNSKQISCFSPASHNKFPSNYNSIFLNECIGRILNS